jgi:hypothetical protein
MDTYKTFEEKDTYFQFGGLKIDNDKDYDHYTKLLMYQYSKKDFIFRGVSEAKYKLYNSAQRLWEKISNDSTFTDDELYDSFIISLMAECKKWNAGTIPNLLRTYEVKENNSFAYLSFMQHFGLPTPLIDFTKNPNKAIFFAVESIGDSYEQSNAEIENYFSIYYTYQNNMAYDIFSHVFEKNRKNKQEGEFDYEDVTRNGAVLLSDSVKEFKIVNNIRIANQEGIFFYNNSPYLAMEEQYKGFTDLLIEKVGKEKAKEMLVHETFSGCFNIHKKYANHMKRVLSEMGITEEFIYPDINSLIKHFKGIFPI